MFVAVFIGAIEVLGLLAQDSHLNGPFWALLENFNINTAGFVIVGVFVVTWVVALAIWHFGRIEQNGTPGTQSPRIRQISHSRCAPRLPGWARTWS